MSKLEFTLTRDQVLIVKRHYEKWLYEGKSSLDDHLNLNPVTLEFDVPSPWRTDIENAPRDGRAILFSLPFCTYRYYDVVRWAHQLQEWYGMNGKCVYTELTYWMEIPELPQP